MAARRLWIAFACELLAYLGVVLLVRPMSVASVVAAILAAMLVVRVSLVLATFALSEPLNEARSLCVRDRTSMWLGECVAFLRFLWLIMGGARTERFMPPATGDHDSPVVVLLHGIFCNGAIWRPIAAQLATRTGCEVRTPSLPRVTARISDQVADFSEWMRRLTAEGPSRPIIIVAHSLGGIIARRYAQSDQASSSRLSLVCIATPHAGSALACLSRTQIAHDLRPGGHALRCSGSAQGILNIQAAHDNLVIPASSSTLVGARNVAIAGCGHIALIYSPEVFELVALEIESAVGGAHRSAISR